MAATKSQARGRAADPVGRDSTRDARARRLYETLEGRSPAERETVYDEIVLMHVDVAQGIARRYRNRGISEDDLFQVACLGLVKASRGYDPSRGGEFLSYAVPTMFGEVKRYFRDHAWMIRAPRRLQDLRAEISLTVAEWRQRTGRLPTAIELAELLGASEASVSEALQADTCYSPTSLDRPLGDDGTTLGALFGRSETGFDQVEAITMLGPLCRQLSERDRRIIYLRFFHDWTQTRIAAELNVTQMQVSRLLRRILTDLHEQMT